LLFRAGGFRFRACYPDSRRVLFARQDPTERARLAPPSAAVIGAMWHGWVFVIGTAGIRRICDRLHCPGGTFAPAPAFGSVVVGLPTTRYVKKFAAGTHHEIQSQSSSPATTKKGPAAIDQGSCATSAPAPSPTATGLRLRQTNSEPDDTPAPWRPRGRCRGCGRRGTRKGKGQRRAGRMFQDIEADRLPYGRRRRPRYEAAVPRSA